MKYLGRVKYKDLPWYCKFYLFFFFGRMAEIQYSLRWFHKDPEI